MNITLPPFNWSDIFAAVSAIGAAFSAGFSWKAINQLSLFERPLLVPNFSINADGKISTVSVTNVGKRSAAFVLVLVSTSKTYMWGQLLDVIQPNETVKRTTTKLRINLKEIPIAKVVVSCIDSMENIQLAWSMDGKVNFRARPQSKSLDIQEIFAMLYPNENLKDKIKVD